MIKRLQNPINSITFASQKHKGCLVRVARSRSAKPFTAVRIRQAPQKKASWFLQDAFFFIKNIVYLPLYTIILYICVIKHSAILFSSVLIFLSLLTSCTGTTQEQPQEPILFRVALGTQESFYFYHANRYTYGYIDTTGRYVINPQFDEAGDFHKGLALVKFGGKWGFIDTTGRYVINPQFDDAFDFSEGLARVKFGGKWGYIDTTGRYVINPQFDDANNFRDGLARVEFGGKLGFIDSTGRYVVNPQFDDADYHFQEGLARVWLDGKMKVINKKGAIIWQE